MNFDSNSPLLITYAGIQCACVTNRGSSIETLKSENDLKELHFCMHSVSNVTESGVIIPEIMRYGY